MDRDRQRAERYGDYSDYRVNSHSATSSWSSEDPPPPHHEPNFDVHRTDFSGDGHRQHHHHHHHHHNSNQRRHHHQNFNSEQRDSLANSDHSLSLPGRKRQFTHSAHDIRICKTDYVDGGSYVKLYVVGIPRTGTEQESPGTGFKPQTVSNAPAPEIVVPSSTSSGVAVPKSARTADSLDCDWSEHTCPDGYMQYYNCVTCESRWEKPEEYFLFEQQLPPPPPPQQQQQQQHSSCQ